MGTGETLIAPRLDLKHKGLVATHWRLPIQGSSMSSTCPSVCQCQTPVWG